MDDNRLVKVAKNKKNSQATWTASKTMLQKMDVNITGEQAHC